MPPTDRGECLLARTFLSEGLRGSDDVSDGYPAAEVSEERQTGKRALGSRQPGEPLTVLEVVLRKRARIARHSDRLEGRARVERRVEVAACRREELGVREVDRGRIASAPEKDREERRPFGGSAGEEVRGPDGAQYSAPGLGYDEMSEATARYRTAQTDVENDERRMGDRPERGRRFGVEVLQKPSGITRRRREAHGVRLHLFPRGPEQPPVSATPERFDRRPEPDARAKLVGEPAWERLEPRHERKKPATGFVRARAAGDRCDPTPDHASGFRLRAHELRERVNNRKRVGAPGPDARHERLDEPVGDLGPEPALEECTDRFFRGVATPHEGLP